MKKRLLQRRARFLPADLGFDWGMEAPAVLAGEEAAGTSLFALAVSESSVSRGSPDGSPGVSRGGCALEDEGRLVLG